jgi:replication-associated recombination protein RarA
VETFDASSDILVEHTIVEVLNKKISLHGDKTLLIIDEYHMLSDAQKDNLFSWMEDGFLFTRIALLDL